MKEEFGEGVKEKGEFRVGELLGGEMGMRDRVGKGDGGALGGRGEGAIVAFRVGLKSREKEASMPGR